MTPQRAGRGYRSPVERPTPWERLRRVDPLVWDSLLAAAVLAVSIGGAMAARHASPPSRPPLGAEGYLLLVLGCVALVVRRRRPLVTLVAVLPAAVALSWVAEGFDLGIAVAIAVYSAAAHLPRDRFARLAAPPSVVAVVTCQILGYPGSNWVEVAIAATFTAGLPMLIGRIGFNRRRRISVDRDRAAADAVAEERARIARELHDVVAHAMSVMVVQAGAARTVVDDDPEAAKAAIGRIEETGRDGLTEMRRLIGILKGGDDGADLAPQPGLDRLGPLLDSIRGAGVPVETVTRGAARPLPAGVDLAAYRFVQEALTNVVKHAGAASARVSFVWDPDALVVEVADDGRGGFPDRASAGHGLVGMRERVSLYGGSFDAGPRPGGGFVVRVRLPDGAPER
jgi:signal transduction histidine kinase